ncbi:MAG: outer membrane protein assembly factor BamD [Thermodesulfobacteriota bacterium]|nr:outer membrane protein assembly factor BamD [Thermodesulfobacteriota bacterium]
MMTGFIRRYDFIWILVLILSITGCSTTKEKKDSSAEVLFNKAITYYNDKKYDKARIAFQKVKDNYPLSKYSITAELRIADSYYRDKEYTDALFYYEDFRKLHPTNKAIPYVIYKIGMCHFNQILSIDRDQTSTEKAAVHFEYLISKYPSETHAIHAKEKLRICNDKLASHELYVGHLYFKTKKYKAALIRFNRIIERFPGSSKIDKAYLYIAKSYISLKEKEKAKDTLMLLAKEHPKSKYTSEAIKLLSKL